MDRYPWLEGSKAKTRQLGIAPFRLPISDFRLPISNLILILILLLPRPISSSCDPIRPGRIDNSFLRPELIDPNIIGAPYLLSFRELYQRYGRPAAIQQQDNVDEWRERLCRVPKAKDIAALIYQSSTRDLEYLRSAIGSKNAALPAVLSTNSFARILSRFRCTEIVDYLIYAKRCEPYVTQRDPWDDTPPNVLAMERLIDEGMSRFLHIESHYVRLRYAYQMIRLAHYAKRYQRALDLYDYLMPKIDHDPSLIEYWIEGHRAGALLALGKNVEASYYYLRVFVNCPSRRESALLSYRLRNEEEWKACLLLCQDDRERAGLYAMRAYAPDSRVVEEMEEVYRLDPRSEHLEPLLVREMAGLEKQLLTPPAARRNPASPSFRAAGERAVDLRVFVRRVLAEGQMERPAFWQISLGYLELIAGDYYAAERSFREAGSMVEDDNLRLQLDMFQLLLKINAWTTVDDEVEQEIDRIRRGDLYAQYPIFGPYLNRKLTLLYQQSDRPGKAFLSQYPLRDLKPNPQADILDDLIEVCRRESPTRLERRMIENDTGGTILNDLLDIRATMLFDNYQLEGALETLKQMDRTEWDNYGLFNPFAERINDCVNCFLPDTLQVFNRGELIEQLLDLDYRAKADPATAAPLYYRMGVAFYNMTYFSYAWRAMDYFRSSVSIQPRNLRDGDNVIPYGDFPFGNREHFDCSQALYYFQKARQMTNDPELGARATFWAAKCERNAYYVNRVQGASRTYEFFADLRQRYAGTEYYQRVVAQCKTFAAYAVK